VHAVGTHAPPQLFLQELELHDVTVHPASMQHVALALPQLSLQLAPHPVGVHPASTTAQQLAL
jgi:hypothetical protein